MRGLEIRLEYIKEGMYTKEPTFYDTNSLTMFWVLAKPDCCFLNNKAQYFGHKNVNKGFVYIRTAGHL